MSFTNPCFQEAEYQLEKSRQAFLGSVIEKLIDVIKDRGLADQIKDNKDLFPALRHEMNGSENGQIEVEND